MLCECLSSRHADVGGARRSAVGACGGRWCVWKREVADGSRGLIERLRSPGRTDRVTRTCWWFVDLDVCGSGVRACMAVCHIAGSEALASGGRARVPRRRRDVAEDRASAVNVREGDVGGCSMAPPVSHPTSRARAHT